MANEACSCSGSTLDRFLRPSVMAILARHPDGRHGYLVAQDLQAIAIFGGCPPDSTGLYRVLRSMEVEGYLQSTWDMEGTGPARRIYSLTDSGVLCLRRWSDTLKNYMVNLEKTQEFIERSLEIVVNSPV